MTSHHRPASPPPPLSSSSFIKNDLPTCSSVTRRADRKAFVPEHRSHQIHLALEHRPKAVPGLRPSYKTNMRSHWLDRTSRADQARKRLAQPLARRPESEQPVVRFCGVSPKTAPQSAFGRARLHCSSAAVTNVTALGAVCTCARRQN